MSEFKIGMHAKLDMLKFKNLGINRDKKITKTSSKQIHLNYKANELATILHPNGIRVAITQIIKETEDTKSFYLKPQNMSLMPPFMPGQYVTLCVTIDGRTYKRPYSISSSPSALQEYRITIKKEENGIVSNYMFNEAKENDQLNLLGPFGHFTYSGIRDQKDLVFLAGGSGITPFLSYLQDDKFLSRINSITLVYGAKHEFDIIGKKEIDAICKKQSKVKVLYVLSEQKRDDYAYGFIDEEKLLNINLENKTIFVSGPIKMYFYLNEIFKKMDIPNKYIRHEIFKEIPEGLEDHEYTLTVHLYNSTVKIPCNSKETLLQSMEKGRVKTLVHCTVGVCGFCRSKLLSGEVKTEDSCVRKKDKEEKYIHPCVTYPLSDVEIEVPLK